MYASDLNVITLTASVASTNNCLPQAQHHQPQYTQCRHSEANSCPQQQSINTVSRTKCFSNTKPLSYCHTPTKFHNVSNNNYNVYNNRNTKKQYTNYNTNNNNHNTYYRRKYYSQHQHQDQAYFQHPQQGSLTRNNSNSHNHNHLQFHNNNNNCLIQNQNFLATVAASVDLLLCTSPKLLTNLATNAAAAATSNSNFMNCLSSLRTDTSEQLSAPPRVKGGAVATHSKQGIIKLPTPTLSHSSNNCSPCNNNNNNSIHNYCSSCLSNVPKLELATATIASKTKPSNSSQSTSSAGSVDRKEFPHKSKHHNQFNRKKSHWKGNNNNQTISSKKEDRKKSELLPQAGAASCTNNNKNNSQVNAEIGGVANSANEKPQVDVLVEPTMTTALTAAKGTETTPNATNLNALPISNSNTTTSVSANEEPLPSKTPALILTSPTTSTGSSTATVTAATPPSPNSYSLQFLHEVGKRMSSSGTIPPYKTNLFPPETIAYPHSTVLTSPPNRLNYPYTNIPDPSPPRVPRFSNLASPYPGHHYHHHSHHHHHPQPSPITIASFLQKDLLAEAFPGGTGGSSGGNNNRSGYDNIPHYHSQHRYSNFYQPHFPSLAQQHNFVSPQNSYPSMGESTARLLGAGGGGGNRDSLPHRSHHHNYYGGNSGGHMPHHQRNSHHNNSAKSNFNANNNRSNTPQTHQTNPSHPLQHSQPHAALHPSQNQQQHPNQKKGNYVSSSASSCSSSSSISSMSSQASNRLQNGRGNANQNMPIETLPKKGNMQQPSRHHRHHHGNHHHQNNTNTTPTTPKHQNYSNLTYVNTEGQGTVGAAANTSSTRANDGGSSARLSTNSTTHREGYRKRQGPGANVMSQPSAPTQTAGFASTMTCCCRVEEGGATCTSIASGSETGATHKMGVLPNIPASILAGNDCDLDNSSARSQQNCIHISTCSSISSSSAMQVEGAQANASPLSIDIPYPNGYPPQSTQHIQQQSMLVTSQPQQQSYRNDQGSTAAATTQSQPGMQQGQAQQSQLYYGVTDCISPATNTSAYWGTPSQQQTNLMYSQPGPSVTPSSAQLSTYLNDRDEQSEQLKRGTSAHTTPSSSPPPPVTLLQEPQNITTQSTSLATGSIAAVAALRARSRTQHLLDSQNGTQDRLSHQNYVQSYPIQNVQYTSQTHPSRSSTPSSSLDSFGSTPPDRFLARSHLVEAKESPPALLDNSKFDKLSQGIWDKYISSQQTEDTFKQKMRLWRFLYIIIKNSYPRYGLYLVGSTISGFGSDTSDVDMCLVSRAVCTMDQRMEAVFNLNLLKDCLSKSEEFEQFRLIEAKVPILRFRDRVHQLEVDLNFNNCVGIKNTHLLFCYSQLDWRLRPLVLVTKLWAQFHNINNAKNMTISSYSLVLMVIHFLQYAAKPRVLPNLHEMFPEKFALADLRSNDFSYVDMNECLEPFDSGNTQSVGELFLQFLEYFSFFNYSQYAISIRTGGILPINMCRQAKAPKNDIHQWKELCIEEPFDLTNTARSVYDFETFERVKAIFQTSWRILREELDLSAIFIPIQTPEPPKPVLSDPAEAFPKAEGKDALDTVEVPNATATESVPETVTSSPTTIVSAVIQPPAPASATVSTPLSISPSTDVTTKKEQATFTKDDAQDTATFETDPSSSSDSATNSNRTNNGSTTTITASTSTTNPTTIN